MFTLLQLSPNRGEEDSFELVVGAPQRIRAASREQGGGWGHILSPVHMADLQGKIMGGITSLPAVLVHKASETDRNIRMLQARSPSCCSWGHILVQQQEIRLLFPAASGLLVNGFDT